MSRLRTAAAMLVESGRALGHAELAKATATQLEGLVAEAELTDRGEEFARLRTALVAAARNQRLHVVSSECLAAAARVRAEELMAELEHPGARLARRLLRAARAARGAWRAG
jgi:hypothetical protein